MFPFVRNSLASWLSLQTFDRIELWAANRQTPPRGICARNAGILYGQKLGFNDTFHARNFFIPKTPFKWPQLPA